MQLPTVRYGLLEQPKLLGKRKKDSQRFWSCTVQTLPFLTKMTSSSLEMGQTNKQIPLKQKYPSSSTYFLFPFLQPSQSHFTPPCTPIPCTPPPLRIFPSCCFCPFTTSFNLHYCSSLRSYLLPLFCNASCTFPSFHRSSFLSSAFQPLPKQVYKSIKCK